MAKDFRSKKKKRPGVQFSIEGEPFTTKGWIPAGASNDILAAVSLDENHNLRYSTPDLLRFMLNVLRETELVTVATAREREALGEHDEPDESAVEWLTFEDARRLEIDVSNAGEDEAADGKVRLVRLSTDDKRRFEKIAYEGEDVDIEVIGEAFIYIVEELQGRPFQPAVVSRRGR